MQSQSDCLRMQCKFYHNLIFKKEKRVRIQEGYNEVLDLLKTVFITRDKWLSLSLSLCFNFCICKIRVTSRLVLCPIVNSAAMNTWVHVSFSVAVSSEYMLSGGIVGSYGSFIPSYLKNLHTVLHVSIYTPINNVREFPFLHTLSRIYCL